MKHIKKKLIKTDNIETLARYVINEFEITKKPEQKSMTVEQALEVAKHVIVTPTFKYASPTHEILYIPEPDLVVLYFEAARYYTKSTIEYKNKLFSSLPDKSKSITQFYSAYTAISSTVLNMFNSLEAAINRSIPDDYTYERKEKNGILIHEKSGIEKDFTFERKVKDVLPDATNKNFVKQFGHKWDIILKLKSLRDEITHAKSVSTAEYSYYENLYTQALNFDALPALGAVRDFINFYQHGLIEECGCGNTDTDF